MLKGLGAAISLPMLEGMQFPSAISSVANSQKSPVRSAFFFMPNGIHPNYWTPEKQGRDFELTRLLEPLNGVKDDLLVLSDLMNQNSNFEGGDGHYARTANILTCMQIKKTTGDNISSGGISLDQLIAQKVGQETLFPSLEYGLDKITTGVDINVGFTRLYGSNISWKSPTQPVSKEIDPRMAFDRLFRNYIPGKKQEEDPFKKSVLDMVMADARALKKDLGRSDQDKVEEYLESIRSVEKRIVNEGKRKDFEMNITPDLKKDLIRVDQNIDEYVEMYAGVDVTEKTRLMMDIIALAFWSDATRVNTFMFGNSVSNRNFSFLEGVNGNHHSISHHMNNQDKMEQYAKINLWHMEQYAYFLNKLKSIKEGDKTLLDNSMVFLTSSLRDGNRHSPIDIPVVLAGKGGGKLKTGQFLKYEERTPLANLYLTMLNCLDIDRDNFGDSTGILDGILA
ncbi:MAG: DUF1552 domain-containing protein [Flammeovirgaceae bacterium]|nr:DUF1552 domain-containing protein [Flammeovirgaceae bacterium]